MVAPFGIRVFDTGAGLSIDASEGLSRWPIRNAGGDLLGHAHGLLLTGFIGDGLSLADGIITVAGSITGATEFETRVVDGLHGLLIVITEPGGAFGNRLYPDAGGSIPMVFSAELRRAGGSADQILSDAQYQEHFLPDRVERMIVREGSGWITGTLTAHRGVERLLPNHYLDLDDFSAHRFWPRRDEFRLDMPLATAAGIAARDIRGFVVACARQFDTVLTLTAGFDSRIIAAAAEPVRDRIGFVTVGEPAQGIDQVMTARMAQGLGLKHRLIPLIPAPLAEQQAWDRHVGHAVRESNRVMHPSLRQIGEQVMLTGMYGETGRARLYRQDLATINDAPATAEFVLSRLTLPLDAEQVENVRAWLAPIAWMPRSAILDLAFNELKFGSWAMAQGPIQKAIKLSLMPFAQRSVQNAFMSVPPLEKGTTALFQTIGEALWPAIMAFPVNRYGDYRDRFTRVSKLFKRESLVRYLRDRFA